MSMLMPHACIVFTFIQADKLDYEVDMVKKDNISIMVVGVGSVKKTDVEKIASWPSYIFTVDEFIKLSSVIHNITRQACSSNEHSTTTATTTTTTTAVPVLGKLAATAMCRRERNMYIYLIRSNHEHKNTVVIYNNCD